MANDFGHEKCGSRDRIGRLIQKLGINVSRMFKVNKSVGERPDKVDK